MPVQPFDDAVVERLELSLSAQQAAVMLQKARAFVETRWRIASALPTGGAAGLWHTHWAARLERQLPGRCPSVSGFRRFSGVGAVLSSPTGFRR